MHRLCEQTQQGLNEKPQAFIHSHLLTYKCTENNHRNKELATRETSPSAFRRCSVLSYTRTPPLVFKTLYKLFGV